MVSRLQDKVQRDEGKGDRTEISKTGTVVKKPDAKVEESSEDTQSETTEQTTSSDNDSSAQESTESDEESSEESSATESEPLPPVLKPPMIIGQSIRTYTTTKPFISSREILAQKLGQKDDATKKGEIVPVSGAKRRRRRQRPLTICLSHCRYELVRSTSQRYGLIEVTEDTAWNIYWTDYSVSLERAVEMRRFQMVNHFPGMNEICRKDLLARNLNRMKRVFPNDYNIYPMTWCLPADNNELQSYSQSRRGKTYICKPEMGCQGRGIFLVKNIKDLNPFGRIICQLYVQKPFLIDHLKFDLRIYVLITSCDPLRVYVYKEGLARFATAKYRQPTQGNTENSYMHLTNYAVNKFSRDFIVDELTGTKRKLTTVFNWMSQQGLDMPKLEDEIDDVIMKTILSAQPILKHHYRTCFPHHDICSACFEILGFDILIDHKLKPYVIEVNHSPSFHTDTKLDNEIKDSLLNDTFAMLHLKQIDRVRIEREDRRRIQERLSSKLAEAKSIMEGKNKNNIKGQPQNEEVPKTPSKPDFNETQFQWELEHAGGYRLIYPLEDSEKYDKFIAQNQVSLYQETAASQARANLTRTQIDEYNLKKQIEEQKRFGGNKVKDKVRPESPTSGTDVTKTKKKKKLVKSSKENGCGMGFTNSFIVSEEECERVKSLMQRGMLIRSLGIELQVYNLLTFVGNLKKSDHDEFRKKHGFTIPSNRPPIMSMETLYTYPSYTSNNPSRQELSDPQFQKSVGEIISPKGRPPNPGGHQTQYLQAKWVEHKTTDGPISYNPSAKTALPPPLSAFGNPYISSTTFQSRGTNKPGSSGSDLPTGAAQVAAIGKQGRGIYPKGSVLNRNTKEIQRRYNMVHDRKLVNALAALRSDLKPPTAESDSVRNSTGVNDMRPQSPRFQQSNDVSKPSTAARKWIAAASMPLEPYPVYSKVRPGSAGTWTSPYLENHYVNDVQRRPTYPVSRFRNTHEISNSAQLGRLLPTKQKRLIEGSIGPSLESAAIIFPRRGNNKINISGNGQSAKKYNAIGDGELGLIRKPGAKSESYTESEQVNFSRKPISPKKKESIPFEDSPLYLKGFHISPNSVKL